MKKTKTSSSTPAHRQALAGLSRFTLQTAIGGDATNGATINNNPLFAAGGEAGNNPLNRT